MDGFSLSKAAILRLQELKCPAALATEITDGINESMFSNMFYPDIERNDPLLIQVVEELQEKANGSCAKLKIVEIPDGIEWEIDEYDGQESIHEKHDTWG